VPRPCPDRPGGPLHARGRRRPVRLGDLPEPDERDRRLAQRQVRRVRQLRPRLGRRQLPDGAEEHADHHLRLAGARPRRRVDPLALHRPRVPRQVDPPLPRDPAVGGAGGDEHDRLAVVARLGVQRPQLDARAIPPDERAEPTPVARASDRGEARDHRRPRVADPPVRGRDLHRRARVDPERGRGRREDRRGDRDQDALVRHAAAPAADRARRPPLRDRLHGRRLRRRADPDRRRAVQQHAGADDLVVRHGDQQRRARRRRRDLPLPVPAARSRDGRDALLRAPSSGRLMRKLPTYLVVTPFAIVLAFPFYWMLVTMFKEDSDLYSGPISTQHRIPYVYNPVRWEFLHSATTKHVAFIFEHTNYPTWIGNTLIVGAAVVGITLLFA